MKNLISKLINTNNKYYPLNKPLQKFTFTFTSTEKEKEKKVLYEPFENESLTNRINTFQYKGFHLNQKESLFLNNFNRNIIMMPHITFNSKEPKLLFYLSLLKDVAELSKISFYLHEETRKIIDFLNENINDLEPNDYNIILNCIDKIKCQVNPQFLFNFSWFFLENLSFSLENQENTIKNCLRLDLISYKLCIIGYYNQEIWGRIIDFYIKIDLEKAYSSKIESSYNLIMYNILLFLYINKESLCFKEDVIGILRKKYFQSRNFLFSKKENSEINEIDIMTRLSFLEMSFFLNESLESDDFSEIVSYFSLIQSKSQGQSIEKIMKTSKSLLFFIYKILQYEQEGHSNISNDLLMDYFSYLFNTVMYLNLKEKIFLNTIFVMFYMKKCLIQKDNPYEDRLVAIFEKNKFSMKEISNLRNCDYNQIYLCFKDYLSLFHKENHIKIQKEIEFLEKYKVLLGIERLNITNTILSF